VKVRKRINIRSPAKYLGRQDRQRKGGKLFAISKFLRAKHSSVQRLIAFLLEGVEKSIFLLPAMYTRKKASELKAFCVFLCFKICHG
jgi:hypothetical protein